MACLLLRGETTSLAAPSCAASCPRQRPRPPLPEQCVRGHERRSEWGRRLQRSSWRWPSHSRFSQPARPSRPQRLPRRLAPLPQRRRSPAQPRPRLSAERRQRLWLALKHLPPSNGTWSAEFCEHLIVPHGAEGAVQRGRLRPQAFLVPSEGAPNTGATACRGGRAPPWPSASPVARRSAWRHARATTSSRILDAPLSGCFIDRTLPQPYNPRWNWY